MSKLFPLCFQVTNQGVHQSRQFNFWNAPHF
jgi:hypothetical protein